ncbi:hypothetical protein QMN07_16680 [Leptospira santarosai]|uniref:tetratricopeptide repeat protein n=1 Tax=Leptospira santarosai TaxID=28183 RepID=UPI0024AFFA91|nr:hypothetical protein [Leptospira santarosai]MDI7219134.1 hypothetical protein [Leptospira santarosai]
MSFLILAKDPFGVERKMVITLIEEILKDSESQELYFEYGQALLHLNRFQESIVSFNKCAKSLFNTSNASEALYYISVGYSKLGDQEKSLQFLQYAIDRGFNDRNLIIKNKDLEQLHQSVLWKENENKILNSILLTIA